MRGIGVFHISKITDGDQVSRTQRRCQPRSAPLAREQILHRDKWVNVRRLTQKADESSRASVVTIRPVVYPDSSRSERGKKIIKERRRAEKCADKIYEAWEPCGPKWPRVIISGAFLIRDFCFPSRFNFQVDIIVYFIISIEYFQIKIINNINIIIKLNNKK